MNVKSVSWKHAAIWGVCGFVVAVIAAPLLSLIPGTPGRDNMFVFLLWLIWTSGILAWRRPGRGRRDDRKHPLAKSAAEGEDLKIENPGSPTTTAWGRTYPALGIWLAAAMAFLLGLGYATIGLPNERDGGEIASTAVFALALLLATVGHGVWQRRLWGQIGALLVQPAFAAIGLWCLWAAAWNASGFSLLFEFPLLFLAGMAMLSYVVAVTMALVNNMRSR